MSGEQREWDECPLCNPPDADPRVPSTSEGEGA